MFAALCAARIHKSDGKEDFMDLLKKIRVLAAEKGVSVSKVERECGFSKNSIIKWDKNMPSGDKILRVAQYFGVSADYLLGNKDSESSEYPEMYFSFLRGAKELDLSKRTSTFFWKLPAALKKRTNN